MPELLGLGHLVVADVLEEITAPEERNDSDTEKPKNESG